jgi:uncharacterized membrane protein YkoI
MIRRKFLHVFVLHAMLLGLITPAIADDDDDDDDDGPGPPPAADGPASGPGPSEQDGALEAVQLGLALPLAVILGRARRRIGGEVIDARLIRAGGALIYELKGLDPATQRVRRYYYDARSGNRVELN